MPGHLGEVARLFLRLGFTAFGGPAAHVAMIEDEVVHRRKWIDRQHFLDLLSAVNFIPGPNSTELAIHLGLIRAGFPGLLVAGLCFITPAVLIILPLGYLYVTYGQRPGVTGPFLGIRAVMIAIIATAMIRFARASIRDPFSAVVGLLAAVLAFIAQWPGLPWQVPQPELILLAASALAGAIYYRSRPAPMPAPQPSPPAKGKTLLLPLLAALPPSSQLLSLCLFFLKVGATLFGSGYVLVSYLQSGLVEQHHWLSRAQLTDAVAVGQVTPGPLLTTSTFIGYILGYRWGGHGMAVAAAVLATASIFAPSFCFVALLGPVWARLRASRYARGALDGMNAAVVALILVTAIALARQSLNTIPAAIVGAAALLILLRWKVNATWLVLAGALAGFLVPGR